MAKHYNDILKAQIKREFELGKPISTIMTEYNVGYTTVYNICKGNKYKGYMRTYRGKKHGRPE